MIRLTYPVILLVLAAPQVASAQPAESNPPGDASTPSASTSSGSATRTDRPNANVVDPTAENLGAEVSDFDKLRTTDSPAFVILGVSPTEIQRPTTPRGFIAALGGFVTESGFAVPKDLALEISPYWLLPHHDLSITDYRADHLARPLRTLSFSIGTTQTKRTESNATGTMVEHIDSDIGVGFRTMVFQAGPLDACTSAANAAGLALAQSMVLSAREQAQLAVAGPIGSTQYNAAFKKLVQAKVDAQFRTDECVALVASTAGFSVDLAGAIDVRAADSKLTRAAASIAGYSLWTDLSYDIPKLSLAGMARITSRKDEMDDHARFDTGIRGIYKSKTYAFSVEALLRHRFTNSEDATTYKVDVALEYQISADTWLSLTFGKDFAFTPGDAGSLFSLAHIQWSVGKPAI